jgi:hypothetical protein
MLTTTFFFNWRIAFWIGAVVALVGAVARTRMRETPDFLNLKRQQMSEIVGILNQEDSLETGKKKLINPTPTWKDKVNPKTLMSYFFMHSGYPLSFYLAYLYFNPTLKEKFGYTAEQIIRHNLFLSMIFLIPLIILAILSYRIHPFRILKAKVGFVILLMIALPFLVNAINTPTQLFLIQALIVVLMFDTVPGSVILIYHLPIYRRYTYASFLWASTRAAMYVITSFGLVYLGERFGPFGIWFVSLPLSAAYLYGLLHFEKLERKLGIYPNLTSNAGFYQIKPNQTYMKDQGKVIDKSTAINHL